MITARENGKAKFYLTTVQLDEIEAFRDKNSEKYEYVHQVIKKVPMGETPIRGAYVGTEAPTTREYRGPRIGHTTIEEHDPIFDQTKSKLTDSHPLGGRADLDIIRAAYLGCNIHFYS